MFDGDLAFCGNRSEKNHPITWMQWIPYWISSFYGKVTQKLPSTNFDWLVRTTLTLLLSRENWSSAKLNTIHNNPGFILTWNNSKELENPASPRDSTCQSLGWIFPCNKVLMVGSTQSSISLYSRVATINFFKSVSVSSASGPNSASTKNAMNHCKVGDMSRSYKLSYNSIYFGVKQHQANGHLKGWTNSIYNW